MPRPFNRRSRHKLQRGIPSCRLPSLLLAGLLPLAPPAWAGAVLDTIAGTGEAGTTGDGGPALAARLNNPFGVVRGPDGALWFCEYDGHTVRRIDGKGIIDTLVGTGRPGFDGNGGPARGASLNRPHEIRFDGTGDLYIADMMNHAIRKWDRRTERLSTVAGTGEAGFDGDGGPAVRARLRQPHSIQFGPDQALYVCDIGNHRVRRVDPATGVITTLAGTGERGPTPDGASFAAVPLNGPRTLDFDPAGQLWLALREGNQVFRLDLAAGTLHHVAGTGAKGFTGHGGPARAATLSGPKGLAVAPNGDIYLADTESHSLRRINRRTGTLELVAGTGTRADGPDGDPRQAGLARPHGVWVDPDGTVFVGDSENHRLRRIRWVPDQRD